MKQFRLESFTVSKATLESNRLKVNFDSNHFKALYRNCAINPEPIYIFGYYHEH